MSIPTAVSQLIEVEETRGGGILSPSTTLAIAVSRVGSQIDGGDGNAGEQRIVCGTLEELASQNSEVFGEPLHSLVIVGKRMHHLESEYAEVFAVDKENWRRVAREVYGVSFD